MIKIKFLIYNKILKFFKLKVNMIIINIFDIYCIDRYLILICLYYYIIIII